MAPHMTTYRAGQRVRIEWRNNVVIEADVEEYYAHPRVVIHGLGVIRLGHSDGADTLSITVLSEPRPDEPTGIGAVVETSVEGMEGRDLWVRAREEPAQWRPWLESRVTTWGPYRNWSRFIDPVVLSEGWKP